MFPFSGGVWPFTSSLKVPPHLCTSAFHHATFGSWFHSRRDTWIPSSGLKQQQGGEEKNLEQNYNWCMTVETCPWVNLKSHTVVKKRKKRKKMQKWQKTTVWHGCILQQMVPCRTEGKTMTLILNLVLLDNTQWCTDGSLLKNWYWRYLLRSWKVFGGSRLARNRSNSSRIKELLKKSVNTKVVYLIVMVF